MRAVTLVGARVQALGCADEGFIDAGDIKVNAWTGVAEGEGMDIYRRAYGDLFELGELVAAGSGVIRAFKDLVDAGDDVASVLFSLYLQAVATGVLMERAR